MRLKFLGLGIVAAALFAGPVAHAFTIENKDSGDQYAPPKFDLEQQAKGFSKDATNAPGGKTLYETPFAGGTVQFGISQGPGAFGAPFSSQLGPSLSSQNSRQEFERRLAPPSSLEYYGVR